MTWHKKLGHRFVERIPRALEPGILYISMEYATAAHSCACGCGEEVVTPLTPTDWSMTFDGETVSLWPSVGNWQLACRSHYVIEKGQVVRAGGWSQRQVAAEQARDKAAKARHYGNTDLPASRSSSAPSTRPPRSGRGSEDSRATPSPTSLPKERWPWSSIIGALLRRR